MRPGSTHIIHRLVLNIEVPRRSMVKTVQDDVLHSFNMQILPRIQQLLDDMDNGQHVVIESIQVDADTVSAAEIPSVLTENILKQFDDAVSKAVSQLNPDDPASIYTVNEQQLAFEVFCYFILSGRLPWYVASQTEWLRNETLWLEKITDVLNESTVSAQKLLQLFTRENAAIKRLFAQFSIDFIRKLTALIWQTDEPTILRYAATLYEALSAGIKPAKIDEAAPKTQLPQQSHFFQLLALAIMLKQGAAHVPDIKKLLLLIEEHIETIKAKQVTNPGDVLAAALIITNITSSQDQVVIRKKQQPADEKERPQMPEEGGIFVSHAGVVITHPFLEYFFKDFGLIQDTDFVDAPARQLAVHLLHYIATGQTSAFEYDMLFEKFLCGWPDDEPIEREVNIPQRMLDEADNMLRAVIKYWKVLKNTSPDGLRGGFLIRDGKLITTEETPRLIVEHNDIDILLSSLPWGLGVIKLPWLQTPFYVEWQ